MALVEEDKLIAVSMSAAFFESIFDQQLKLATDRKRKVL
jgi:hypothetical protein